MRTERHICTACNFVYEPPCAPKECGCDASFKALPENWLCPGCGGEKDKFQPYSWIKVSDTQKNPTAFTFISHLFERKPEVNHHV